MKDPHNKVLDDDYQTSDNFYESDRILRTYLNHHLQTRESQFWKEMYPYSRGDANELSNKISYPNENS